MVINTEVRRISEDHPELQTMVETLESGLDEDDMLSTLNGLTAPEGFLLAGIANADGVFTRNTLVLNEDRVLKTVPHVLIKGAKVYFRSFVDVNVGGETKTKASNGGVDQDVSKRLWLDTELLDVNNTNFEWTAVPIGSIPIPLPSAA